MRSQKVARASIGLVLLFFIVAVVFLFAARGRKPLDQRALDVARQYVIALSVNDSILVDRLSLPNIDLSFSEQLQRAFSLSQTSDPSPPNEVAIDGVKVLSSSGDYLDALNEEQKSFLVVGTSRALSAAKTQVKQRYNVDQVEFLLLTTHEVKDPTITHMAYVTVVSRRSGEWFAIPGINPMSM